MAENVHSKILKWGSLCKSLFFERIFVILLQRSGLIDRVHDPDPVGLAELTLQPDVEDLGRVGPEVFGDVDGEVVHRRECHDPEISTVCIQLLN